MYLELAIEWTLVDEGRTMMREAVEEVKTQ